MSLERQSSVEQVLDFQPPTSGEITLTLSDHPCFGNSGLGGYIAATLQKVGVLYAAEHPILKKQPDVRAGTTTFFRPVFPAKCSFRARVHELSVGRAWSFLRVELFEEGSAKLCASADLNITNFSIPGVTLDTRWKPLPAPTPVDLKVLENEAGDENWTCYHTPYYPNGFRRAHSYVKYFIPRSYDHSSSFVEQWVLPGWDCTPLGSRDPNVPEARWTTEALPFLADLNLPVQENFFPQKPGTPIALGSIAQTLEFAATQEEARRQGKKNWRELGRGAEGDGATPDGFKAFTSRKNTINNTIVMSLEIKKKLPTEGVRWLYLRGEIKSVRDGRQDWQILCFDETMDLVFIRTGIEYILDSSSKNERKSQSEAKSKAQDKANL